MKKLFLLVGVSLAFYSCSNSEDFVNDYQDKNDNINKQNKIPETPSEEITATPIFELILKEENRTILTKNESIQLFIVQSPNESIEVRLSMQGDGNLVSYVRTYKNSKGLKIYPIWSTNTNQPIEVNPFLTCQLDGNLVLYKYYNNYNSSNALWSTNSAASGTFTNSYIKYVVTRVTYSDLSSKTYVKFLFYRNNTFYKEIFSRDITNYYNDII